MSAERNCIHHSGHPAIAICWFCGQDICAQCHQVTITGSAVCGSCEYELRAALHTKWEAARTLDELIYGFAETATRMITGPRDFFARLPPIGSWVRAATFGTLCYIVALGSQILWGWLFLPEFTKHFATPETAGLSPFAVAVMIVFAIPMAAPFAFAMHTAVLWFSMRLFGANAPWQIAVRIAGYAAAGHLLGLIPPIGQFPIGYLLGTLWFIHAELTGIRRYFPELGPWRTLAIVFVPLFALSGLGL